MMMWTWRTLPQDRLLAFPYCCNMVANVDESIVAEHPDIVLEEAANFKSEHSEEKNIGFESIESGTSCLEHIDGYVEKE